MPLRTNYYTTKRTSRVSPGSGIGGDNSYHGFINQVNRMLNLRLKLISIKCLALGRRIQKAR